MNVGRNFNIFSIFKIENFGWSIKLKIATRLLVLLFELAFISRGSSFSTGIIPSDMSLISNPRDNIDIIES